MLRRVNWHILPVFFSLAMLCSIDRSNLSFAASELNEDLGFDDRIYGLGSGNSRVGGSDRTQGRLLSLQSIHCVCCMKGTPMAGWLISGDIKLPSKFIMNPAQASSLWAMQFLQFRAHLCAHIMEHRPFWGAS